jgi:DegV family protein with EDD domain
MSTVTVLTDSSAYLPQELISKYPIRVMPLTLIWDGKTYRDGVDIKAAEFYLRLSKSRTLPTTSQVAAGEIITRVNEILSAGQDVLILPISSGISSTYPTAAGIMKDFPQERVALLDTRLVSMALGFQVLTAARLAASGASLAECKQAAMDAYDHIGVYFIVDTLKYLAAGGRINTAKRLMGTALSIKPILAILDGKIELVSSVRTRRKAMDAMLDLVEKGIARRSPVRISVFHAMAEELANELMATVKQRFSPIELILAEVSPVIGAHVGPGTIAIAYQAGR